MNFLKNDLAQHANMIF